MVRKSYISAQISRTYFEIIFLECWVRVVWRFFSLWILTYFPTFQPESTLLSSKEIFMLRKMAQNAVKGQKNVFYASLSPKNNLWWIFGVCGDFSLFLRELPVRLESGKICQNSEGKKSSNHSNSTLQKNNFEVSTENLSWNVVLSNHLCTLYAFATLFSLKNQLCEKDRKKCSQIRKWAYFFFFEQFLEKNPLS